MDRRTNEAKEKIPLITAAKRAGISPQSMYAYASRGAFKSAFKRNGTRWYIERWEMEDLIAGKIDVSGVYEGWRG
jgi:hypothetical protein